MILLLCDGMVRRVTRFIKKLAAWIIKSELKKLRENAHETGRALGYSEGHDRGIAEGKKRGFDEGKSIFVLQDKRTPAHVLAIDIDNSVYGPRPLPVSDLLIERMRKTVSDAASEGIVSMPTPSQWEMILSEHPSTCVVAGAGSGKSTTLVLRVVFMHCYLNIPLSEITVISFTRASCDELRSKIYEVLKFWIEDITREQVNGVVRTFHSALSAFGRDILGRREWFDILKDDDAFLISGDDIDNPLSSGKLTTKQKNILNEAYIKLFNENEHFREHILSLMKLAAFYAPSNDNEDPKRAALQNAAYRDLALAKKLNEVWEKRGLWPIDGVTPEPVECFRTKNGLAFYANGVIENTKQPVFLTGKIDREYFFDKNEQFEYTSHSGKEESFPIIPCISVRNKILAWGCDKLSIFVDSSSKHDMFKFLSRDATEGDVQDAPFFDLKLNGELIESNIVEVLYQQASFVESMGMEVTYAMNNIRAFKEKGLEYHFCRALSLFWGYFEQMLDDQGYISFNRAFLILSEKEFLKANRHKLDKKYKPLRHLLIDEFQDISPQIAMWIKAVQQELASQEQEPSIMAIGDDWQSIYAWRGSSPEIFMNFSRIFPAHQQIAESRNIKMMENFRSDSKILHDAELLMKDVRKKINKQAVACRKPDGDEAGVVFIDYDPDGEVWVQDVVRCIQEQVELVSKQQKSDKNKVIVLSRTNPTLSKIKRAGRFGRGVAFHTIHTAKGLQGEVAIILEDSRSLVGHTFRNRIYEIVHDFTSSYDDAMDDEALRLAYVAVTRGVKRVFWFAPQNSSGAYSTMKSACGRTRK